MRESLRDAAAKLREELFGWKQGVEFRVHGMRPSKQC